MPPESRRRFATTHWTLVLAAGDASGPQADDALAALCELYWFPVFAFIRRTVGSSDDARDLTQAFFADLIERRSVGRARPERGRFRTFLLTAARNFLANQRDAARAAKRGGGRPVLSLDFNDGERRYLVEPADRETPDEIYERRWALAVVERALARLAETQQGPRQEQVFAVLKPLLTDRESGSYERAAVALGATEAHVRVMLHRLRKQFGACLREVIRDTTERDHDVDGELLYLLSVLSRG